MLKDDLLCQLAIQFSNSATVCRLSVCVWVLRLLKQTFENPNNEQQRNNRKNIEEAYFQIPNIVSWVLLFSFRGVCVTLSPKQVWQTETCSKFMIKWNFARKERMFRFDFFISPHRIESDNWSYIHTAGRKPCSRIMLLTRWCGIIIRKRIK